MNHIDVEASRRLATLNPTGCPVGIEPRLWRKTLWQRAQTHLDLATALLALVDGIDGDCDLEDNADDEPSIGSYQLQGEVDLEGDNADDEPSLGAPETSTETLGYFRAAGDERLVGQFAPSHSQAWWARGVVNADLEQDIQDQPHDGELDLREGDQWEELEHSLGWAIPSADTDQSGVYTSAGTGVDLEADYVTYECPVGSSQFLANARQADEEPDNRNLHKTLKRQWWRRQAAAMPGQARLHGMVLKTMPERYAMMVEGDCCHPEIPHGSRLEFSTTERARPGDFVAIYRWAQFVQPGQWQVMVKRLTIDCRHPESGVGLPGLAGPGIMYETLNPHRHYVMPAEHIEAIHKVVRIIPPDEDRGPRMSAAEVAAMGLSATHGEKGAS